MGRLVKRALDIAGALLGLLLLSPLLLAAALAVKRSSPGPVFYVQERVGQGGRPFRLVKFRTMVVGADRHGTRLHESDPLITPAGRWLRRFSLDELPQLFNVLAGEMSLVGPRPALPRVVERMSPAERRRLAVRPRLTGGAQGHAQQIGGADVCRVVAVMRWFPPAKGPFPRQPQERFGHQGLVEQACGPQVGQDALQRQKRLAKQQ